MRLSRRILQPAFGLLLALLVASCSVSPPFRNEPIPREMNAVSQYSADATDFRETSLQRCRDRSKSLSQCRDDRETAFVGIAISGGGSRAANFAAAVMQELSNMGIMQQANVISSVSGGSVAAAYYVTRQKDLVGPTAKPDGWLTAKKDLSQQFRSKWTSKLLRPDKLSATLFGSTGRTEYLADVFDDTLFKKMTMGQLPSDGPALILNATAINQLNSRAIPACTSRGYLSPWMRWESIPFRNWFFNGCLESRLDTYPVSLAVAASAAFPGVFSAVPLARWDTQTKPDGTFAGTVAAEYVHLIDGGPSDNLGIDGLLGEWASDAAMNGDIKVDHCLIISIDAFVRGDTDERALKVDPRGALGRLVDPNFFDAIDAMLARRRFDTLQRLGLAPPQFKDTDRFVNVPDVPLEGKNYQFFEQEHVAIDVSPRKALGEPSQRRERIYADGRREVIPEPLCMVWHIGLDNIRGTLTSGWRFGAAARAGGIPSPTLAEYKSELKRIAETPQGKHTIGVAEISSRVRTDFDLVGPKNCSSDQLRDVIWEAGRIAVAADLDSRRKVCRWFKTAGLATSADCDAPKPAIVGEPVAAAFVESANPMYGDFSVACK